MTQTLEQLSAAATQGEWLPCPFCGGQAQITERPQSSKDTGFFCAISCFCGGYSAHAHQHGIAETKEAARHEAIAAWNTRTGQLVAVQPDDATVERYRHKKRGTVYEVIGEAELQTNTDNLVDGSQMMVYRGDDGKLWCRHYDEFHDGRFEAMKGPKL